MEDTAGIGRVCSAQFAHRTVVVKNQPEDPASFDEEEGVEEEESDFEAVPDLDGFGSSWPEFPPDGVLFDL
jgi:hypothetical protein